MANICPQWNRKLIGNYNTRNVPKIVIYVFWVLMSNTVILQINSVFSVILNWVLKHFLSQTVEVHKLNGKKQRQQQSPEKHTTHMFKHVSQMWDNL